MKKASLTVVLSTALLLPMSSLAGVVYKDGDKYMKLGGRIQLQYHKVEPDEGESTDDMFFRRLRPYIEGSLHPNWKGKFQWDMGKANGDNEVSIKDAYMQYKSGNMKVTIGNYLFPFSRETLTSSKYQQLVERTFVGDHNYGSPDRQAGVFVQSMTADKKLDWALGIADARIDPDDDKIDFDTAVNDQEDWNEGFIIGGRVSYHPFGHLKMKQGDFSGEQKATISIAAFSWSNDKDNNTRTDGETDTSDGSKPDLDTVTGIEISGAYRGNGLSIDLQYNIFSAETTDSSVTSGVFEDGETELTNYSLEAGYMVMPAQLEIVVSYSSQDADNYESAWTRTEFGANWFVKKHHIKFQLTYRVNENAKGKEDSEEDEIFLQSQFVF